ncbi:MAG: DUF2007 domain-containing protein [Rikenellaceae bacterium]
MGKIETDGIIVGKFSTIAETNIVKGLLESNGITSYIRNAALSNIFPNIPICASEIELVVRNEDFEKANNILEAEFDKAEF